MQIDLMFTDGNLNPKRKYVEGRVQKPWFFTEHFPGINFQLFHQLILN